MKKIPISFDQLKVLINITCCILIVTGIASLYASWDLIDSQSNMLERSFFIFAKGANLIIAFVLFFNMRRFLKMADRSPRYYQQADIIARLMVSSLSWFLIVVFFFLMSTVGVRFPISILLLLCVAALYFSFKLFEIKRD